MTASPNPGVSTTVSLSLTPFSSMSTVVASMLTVCVTRSVRREGVEMEGREGRGRGGEREWRGRGGERRE